MAKTDFLKSAKKFLCTVSRISSRLVTFGLETNRTRPSRVSSRLVTCRLGLVSSRDFRLVTGSKKESHAICHFFEVFFGIVKLLNLDTGHLAKKKTDAGNLANFLRLTSGTGNLSNSATGNLSKRYRHIFLNFIIKFLVQTTIIKSSFLFLPAAVPHHCGSLVQPLLCALFLPPGFCLFKVTKILSRSILRKYLRGSLPSKVPSGVPLGYFITGG